MPAAILHQEIIKLEAGLAAMVLPADDRRWPGAALTKVTDTMPISPQPGNIDQRSLASVLSKITNRGLGWTVRRLVSEFRMPTTGPGKLLRNVLSACEARGRRIVAPLVRQTRGDRNGMMKDRTLFAFYDLDVMPPTFDVASFLFLAELERRRQGLDRIHFIVVPGRNLEPQNEAEKSVSDVMRQMRVGTILFPVSRLLASCRGVTVCATREEASSLRFGRASAIFPADASPTFPRAPDQSLINDPALANMEVFPILSAPESERIAVDTWLRARIGDRLPIVITLRESGFMPARNSNVDAWVRFADTLDQTRYAPIFVRDTERALDVPGQGLERFPVFEAVSWNVPLRMALYEAAHVNLAVMHGAMELCWFNEACRYAAFMPVGTSPQTSPEFLGSRGFADGRSLPFAKPWQKLVWRPQEHSDIADVFSQLLQDIDGASASKPDNGVSERPHK